MTHGQLGQRGGITRLLACSAEQLKTYQGLDIGPTFVHHNHRGDEKMNYAAFNKPASVNYWVRSGVVPADVEFVMQLDAELLLVLAASIPESPVLRWETPWILAPEYSEDAYAEETVRRLKEELANLD